MATGKLFLLVAPLLLLLALSIPSPANAVEIISGDGQQGVGHTDPGADNLHAISRRVAEVAARNQVIDDLFSQGATLDMWMVLICMDLQNVVPQCRRVQEFDTFLSDLPQIHPTVKRRKRFASNSWFGSSFNSPWQGSSFGSFPHPWSGANSPNFGPGGSSGGGSSHPWSGPGSPSLNPGSAVVCPSPTNQSFIYNLNSDSAEYPAREIGQEVLTLPPGVPPGTINILQLCLAREVVRPTDPPALLTEPFEQTAEVTCPFDQRRLWQYRSLITNTMCWVLQNFQENILFRNCLERFCQNCPNANSRSGGWFGYGPQQSSLSRKFCITEYRTVSLWAYCPALQPGTRIIRDRIIVPFACSCQSIRCDPVPRH